MYKEKIDVDQYFMYRMCMYVLTNYYVKYVVYFKIFYKII